MQGHAPPVLTSSPHQAYMLHYISTSQHGTAQHSTAQHSTAQLGSAQLFTASGMLYAALYSHGTAQHSAAQRSAASHLLGTTHADPGT